MSDFIYSTRRRRRGELSRALEPWLRPLAVELEERHGDWGSLVVAMPAHERHALHEDGASLSVVVGCPVARLEGRPPARIDRGDRRAAVHGALTHARSCAERLDGHFAAVRIATGAGPGGGGAVLTDRFGFVALYEADAAAGGLLVGTHVDAVAAAAGCGSRIDPVSAVDLCVNYASTWPWTLYEGVRQVEPGTVRPLGADGWAGPAQVYWRPWEPEPRGRRSSAGLAVRLREGLLESVASATRESGRAAVLLSGGEDSRAVLAAVPEDVRARGVVFAEWESREVRIARRVARAHGAQVDVALRPSDHYAAGFPSTARLAGSGHVFVDVHGLGLEVDPPLAAEPVVLGGLSADALLKGLYAPKKPAGRVRSVRLPGLRSELLDAVDERRNAALERMREWRPESAEEWLRLWPFSMRKHSGNVEGSRRQFRSWEAFHATSVLEVAAGLRPEDARGGRVYHRAMRPLFARTALVPHADYRFPYLGRLGNALALPALALARGVRAVATGEVRVRHRSWPKWRVLVASEPMRDREEAVPLRGSPLARIFSDSDPRSIAAARAEWYALRRLMLMQLGEIVRIQEGQGMQEGQGVQQ